MLALAFAAGSCTQKGQTAAGSGERADSVATDTANATAGIVYEDTVPAADCPGIVYTVTLDTVNGTFTIKETYLEAENGKDQTFNYSGKLATKQPAAGGDTYLTLKDDKHGDTYTFKVMGDSVLRMVNDQLEEPASAANYDLHRKAAGME